MRASVDESHRSRATTAATGEHRDVLEAFRMIAHDRGWLRRLREAVSSGLTAEAAVERVQNDARAKLQRQTDPYLRDRLHDLDRHRQSPPASARRPEPGPAARRAAGERHPGRPLDEPGGAARLRPLAAARSCARGGRRVEPHRHRRARARDARGQRHPEHHRNRRAGRRDHRRRRRRAKSIAAAVRRRGGLSPRRRGCARAGRRSIALCATCRPSTLDGVRSGCT